jgi:hypothetical protein
MESAFSFLWKIHVGSLSTCLIYACLGGIMLALGVLCSLCQIYARLAEFMLAIRFLQAHKKKQPPLLLSLFITL